MKIIKIGALWCPACLMMKPIIKKLKNSNIDIIEYDYDFDEEMVSKFNVGKILPVIIKIDESGTEISRLIGEKTEKEVEDFINEK